MCPVSNFIYSFVRAHVYACVRVYMCVCVHVYVCTGWFRRNLPYCRITFLKLNYINITKNTCI